MHSCLKDVLTKRTSLSSWRAWIEITARLSWSGGTPRRSPHGERGLKCRVGEPTVYEDGRSPHGERGLKYGLAVGIDAGREGSLSSWRAWIEIAGG